MIRVHSAAELSSFPRFPRAPQFSYNNRNRVALYG
jgi:hypothetical protein